MAKKKTYIITVHNGFIRQYLSELKHWGISRSLYKVNDNVVTTQDLNVVDVATETFMNLKNNVEIVEVK